jgi:pSer/pThr/pTyr-binding forkhead associated (FHA) protein
MEIRLLVVQGKPLGKEIPVKESRFLIGRSDECHLRPNSELVSRTHCQITVESGVVRLRDLGSSNGTIVNGERVTEDVVIDDGDLVQVGPLGFQVILVRDSVPESVTRQIETTVQADAVTPAAPAPTVPVSAAVAAGAVPRTDKLGSREASGDDIHQWLVGDSKLPVPDSPSGVYGGDTQMMSISALQDTTADHKSGDTPPDGVPASGTQLAAETPGDEVVLADGRKAKVGSAKQVIEKTREDTSRAASDILRRMMERRPGGKK